MIKKQKRQLELEPRVRSGRVLEFAWNGFRRLTQKLSRREWSMGAITDYSGSVTKALVRSELQRSIAISYLRQAGIR